MKIAWAPQYSTAQVHSSGAEVALSNKRYQQIGPFVFCKDFLHDAIRAKVWNTPSSIYGYKTGASELSMMTLDAPYVLLANDQNPQQASQLDNIKDFLNQIEDAVAADGYSNYVTADSPPSKYSTCGVSWWSGPKLWMISPPAFSLWTLLLRNGHVHTIGEPWQTTVDKLISGDLKPGVKTDSVYLQFGKVALDVLVANGLAKTFGNQETWTKTLQVNYPEHLSVSTLHHWGGIVSYAEKSAQQAFPDVKWIWPTVDVKAPAYCHY